MNNRYAIIMAGGVGSRFWPISTSEFPKQFHDFLDSGNTLIQQTFNRLKLTIPIENIFVASNSKYKNIILDQLPQISEKQLILEPVLRNTAPCILYAAKKINAINANALLVVTPSDHNIEQENQFSDQLNNAFEACNSRDVLITLGINPTEPNTGFGYIKYDKSSDETAKKVIQFSEKPNLEKATSFIKSQEYLWNAGIFIWSTKSILASFEKQLPQMYSLFSKDESKWNTSSEYAFIKSIYAESQNISVDFGILEKAKNVFVIPVNFSWDDLGTWGALYKKLPKDKNKNVTIGGKVLYKNATNNIVFTQSKKQVVLSGIKNCIVVEKDNVLLIHPLDQEQKIKEITKDAAMKFGSSIT